MANGFTWLIDLSVCKGAINVPLLHLFEPFDSVWCFLWIKHLGNRDIQLFSVFNRYVFNLVERVYGMVITDCRFEVRF